MSARAQPSRSDIEKRHAYTAHAGTPPAATSHGVQNLLQGRVTVFM